MIQLVALVLAVPLAQWEPEQPCVYTSASGEFELHVDPSDRSGGGPGRHALRRHGEAVWEKTLPVTLLDAVVTSDGTVAGFGYPEIFWSIGATGLHVFVIGPDGEMRQAQVVEQDEPDFIHGSPYPLGLGLLCDESRDRLVVRVSERPSQMWWTYRLSDGARIGELRPPSSRSDHRWESLIDARAVPGFALYLIQYETSDWREEILHVGTAYTLIDETGREVWRLPIEDVFVFGDDGVHLPFSERDARRAGALIATSDRSFALLHARTNERVDYLVEETEQGSGWTVIETSRAPFVPEPERRENVEALEVQFPLLATTQLGGEDPASSTDVLEKPMAIGVDRVGRIYVQDAMTGSVHVFDRSGERVRLCRAAQDDADGARFLPHFAFGQEGDIYVKDEGMRRVDDRSGPRHVLAYQSGLYLHFGPDGTRLGVVDLGGVQVAFAPEGVLLAGRKGARWCISGDSGNELVIRSADGEILVSQQRRPGDRRWLDPSLLRGLAVAPNGSAAVVSEGLALFAADGAPLRTIALPEDAGTHLDFDCERALLSAFGPTVHIVLLADDSVRRFTARGAEGASWRSFLAPDGSELWMVEGFEMQPKSPPRLTLHRFALD